MYSGLSKSSRSQCVFTYILAENKGWITIDTVLFGTPCCPMWYNRDVLDLWS